ncbi:unnamed protein product, partial [Rotaria sp. Silwood2]
LSQPLTELRQKLPATLRVYRGAVLPRESFNKLKHIVRQRTFVSTFGYLSTSKNLEVAKLFASNEATADVSQNSEFPEEEEVLFDIDSTFEILNMNVDEENRLYTICMRTSTYGSELASEYLRYNEKVLDQLT